MPSVMELERLITIFQGEASGLLRACDQVERALRRTSQTSGQTGNVISRTFTMTTNVAQQAANALVAVADATKYIAINAIQTAMQMEVLEASFKALIGSADESSKLLTELSDFALKSPFITPQLMEASIELAAFGRQADEILPDLKMIGDIARGDAQRFKEMVYIYGKIIESGRLYQRDINQLAIRGVPVYIELAKMLGLVGDEAKKIPMEMYTHLRGMIQSGQINAEMVHKIFEKITSPGGLFFGQTEKRMQTLAGVLSNVEEHIVRTQRRIGDALVSGMNLKPFMTMLDEMGRRLDAFFANLTPQIKETIRTVIAVTAVFLALAVAVAILGVVFNLMFGWIGIVVLVIGAAIGMTTQWILTIGGLEEAWHRLKRAADDFWTMLKPALIPVIAILAYMYPYMTALVVVTYLLARNWDEVTEAVEDFYVFIRPTLQAVWALVKTLAFGIRDGLVTAWEHVTKVAVGAALKIQEVQQRIGAEPINWDKAKSGIRDFVLAVDYGFNNLEAVARYVLATLEFVILKWAETVLKYIMLPLTAPIAAAVMMFGVIKTIITGFIKWVGEAVPKAAKIILDALENFDFTDLDTKIINALGGAGLKGVQEVAAIVDEIDKALGEVKFNKLEIGGFKIPVGVKIEGLTKLQEQALEKMASRGVVLETGFAQHREMRLKQFLVEDINDAFRDAFNTMWDHLGMPQAEEAGKGAGYAFAQGFKGEVKAIDAVLFNSAEAVARINTYTAGLRDPMMVDRTRTYREQINLAPMPREKEEPIDVLRLIHQAILEQNNKLDAAINPLRPAGF